MSRVDFDEPRLEEMQEFLNYLYTIGIQNSDIDINNSLVYRELCKYSIRDREIDEYGNLINYSYLFDKWKERNRDVGSYNKGLIVMHDISWPHFLQFFSKKDYDAFHENHNFIKLYIPVKYDGIYDTVNVLFDYIRDSGISHLSIVSDKTRSDNVIVRLDKDDLESAIKIINYIKNDNVINSSLNKTNPFVPTINGIGFMYETGISYNKEISILISKYINFCISYQIKPTINDFYKWFKGNNYNKEVASIFSYAIGERKFIEISDEIELENSKKQRLFIEAIKATFLKYDMNQVMLALKSLLEDNDYSSFTNGNGEIKYRNELKKNVSRNEVIEFIESMLPKDTELNYQTIRYYCLSIFKNELLKDFCQACLVTQNNYDINSLKHALRIMIKDNNPKSFSRYAKDDINHEKNYRTLISKLNKNGITNLMKLFLEIKNIYYNEETDDLINVFTDNLMNLDYQADNDNQRKR